MKSTLKIFLAVCLFCSVAFADGEMTSGKPSCTSGCGFADGEMTSGGKLDSDLGNGSLTAKYQNDSILIFIQEYLRSIFG